jgi:TRAP transporter TAXI family solute receptor
MKARQAIARAWRRGKDVAGTYGIGIAILVAGTLAAYQFIDPAPPREITLATGEPGGAYEKFGKRYADILSRQGISVQLRSTVGSVENLELLTADTDVDLAFVQSGLAKSNPSPGVVALGSLFFEPLWLFLRNGFQVADIQDLVGARVAVGAEGSGTRVVALTVLEANGVSDSNTQIVNLPQSDMFAALTDGDVDAVFLVASPESEYVTQMVDATGLQLHHFQRTAAYARIYPFLPAVLLPEGVLNLERNIPATDLSTVAPTALLVARESLHPALVDLLLVAAQEIHGHSGLLSDAGQFPTPQYSDLPISAEASRHYRYGPPFLLRILPFWAATLVDRLKIMLLPLFGLALPLVKLAPPIYEWRIRSRILRLYSEVTRLDPARAGGLVNVDITERLARLDRVDREVAQLTVPLAYTDELYNLRRDIDLVRRKLNESGQAGEADS